MTKRTKYQTTVDRLANLAPLEIRRLVAELRAHECGPYVIDLLQRALAEPPAKQLELVGDADFGYRQPNRATMEAQPVEQDTYDPPVECIECTPLEDDAVPPVKAKPRQVKRSLL